MSSPANPQAMVPKAPQKTRTAPPTMPEGWWAGQPRLLRYVLFGASGFIYFFAGMMVLYLACALSRGPEEWQKALECFQSTPSRVYHALALLGFIWVGLRFFSFFGPAQPRKIGPLKPPPDALFYVVFYAGMIVVNLGLAALLWGKIL